MTPARFRWGLILILIGLLLLFRNMEVLNDNFWGDLLIWFPVVLIAVGLEKIFANTRVKIISYLTSVALFGAGLLIAFAGSYGGSDSSFFSEATFELPDRRDIQYLRTSLDVDATDLTIRDSGDKLIYGRFDRFTRKPEIEQEFIDDTAIVQLSSRASGSYLGGAIKIETGESQDWFLQFSERVPLELECSGRSADLHLNLSTTPLKRLNLKTEDARIYLKLGDLVPLVKVSILGEDSNLRLRVPKTVGVLISGRDYETYLGRLGFKEMDGLFISEGFDTLENRIEVELDDRLKSFSVDFF